MNMIKIWGLKKERYSFHKTGSHQIRTPAFSIAAIGTSHYDMPYPHLLFLKE